MKKENIKIINIKWNQENKQLTYWDTGKLSPHYLVVYMDEKTSGNYIIGVKGYDIVACEQVTEENKYDIHY